jgi:dephospho-CoA kinase
MFKLGLTGGIGSGKTLVCQIFEKLGVPVYYADTAARLLMNTDAELKSGIKLMFGEQAFGRDGLDRQYLADSVFGDHEKLSGLNRLVHPSVRKDFIRWTDLQMESPYVIEEAAILFESGASIEMNLSVLVYAPEELRISRVMKRDGVGREAVLKRMGHQLGEEELMEKADHVLINDGTQMLLPQVIELHNKILNCIE